MTKPQHKYSFWKVILYMSPVLKLQHIQYFLIIQYSTQSMLFGVGYLHMLLLLMHLQKNIFSYSAYVLLII